MGTHNHAAPIQIVPDNFEYGRKLADVFFELINRAIKAEQGPARVLSGKGYGYFIRSVGNAPSDYEIHLLKVMIREKTLAVLFNHPTHPLQSSLTQIDTRTSWIRGAIFLKLAHLPGSTGACMLTHAEGTSFRTEESSCPDRTIK